MNSRLVAACLACAWCAGCGGRSPEPPAKSAAVRVSIPVPSPSGLPAMARWVGRVDTSDPAAARFAWSGSGFVANVSGNAVAVRLATEGTSEPVYFQPVIDGAPGKRFAVAGGPQTVPLAEGLTGGNHVVELYRETEGRFGTSVFRGFVAGQPNAPPPAPARSIEVIGDSISAGFGNLGTEEHPNYGPDPRGGCAFTTESESAYRTYGAIAARTLGASASIVAVSGWGVYRDNGNATNSVLASVYGNTLGLTPSPPWSFTAPADVVVINLGTNDFAKGDPGEQELEAAYRALLTTVRQRHPKAWIFCMIGPLLYGSGLSQATAYTTAIVAERHRAGDAKVALVSYGQQDISRGTGCAYHPNVAVHEAMAKQLVSAIRSALGW